MPEDVEGFAPVEVARGRVADAREICEIEGVDPAHEPDEPETAASFSVFC